MKRTSVLILTLLLAALMLAGCCSHQWSEAQCNTPQRCEACGEIQGETLGHGFLPATCEAPRTCSRCGLTDGTPLGHDWQGGTCEAANVCTRCAAEEAAPGHSWTPATCQVPETCSICGTVQGACLPHDLAAQSFDDQTFRSCCTQCGQPFSEPMTDSLPESWILGTWADMLTFHDDGTVVFNGTDATLEGTWKSLGIQQKPSGLWDFRYEIELGEMVIRGGMSGDMPAHISLADDNLLFQFIGEKNK